MRNLGKNLAKLIKEGRLAHPKKYSQNELASILGLCGQTISNIERGLCSLNVRHVIKISKVLEIPFETLKKAMVQDYEEALTVEIYKILDTEFNRSYPGVKLRETGQASERVL